MSINELQINNSQCTSIHWSALKTIVTDYVPVLSKMFGIYIQLYIYMYSIIDLKWLTCHVTVDLCDVGMSCDWIRVRLACHVTGSVWGWHVMWLWICVRLVCHVIVDLCGVSMSCDWICMRLACHVTVCICMTIQFSHMGLCHVRMSCGSIWICVRFLDVKWLLNQTKECLIV